MFGKTIVSCNQRHFSVIMMVVLMYAYPNIGRFHSVLKHGKTLGGQLHTCCQFKPCGSEQILFNSIYLKPNIRSIPVMNN